MAVTYLPINPEILFATAVRFTYLHTRARCNCIDMFNAFTLCFGIPKLDCLHFVTCQAIPRTY